MRLLMIPLVVVIGLLQLGCGGKAKLSLVPVKGQLLLKQKNEQSIPMGGARIVFVPVSGREQFPGFPNADTDGNGNFTVGTYENSDGAPEGQYVVTVEWKEKQTPKYDFSAGHRPRGPDRLKGIYSSSEKSSLRATIRDGEELIIIVPAP